MVRAPCCEKMGLKKGPWTPEEDQLLVSYIQKHGHGNWRALPKQAGLLRCGKSCRLRWINYLRPDIKRGNLTQEEEESIIKLHELLGNRWSAIAARLPGRTDNEIKNVWHTHLKKKLKDYQPPKSTKRRNSAKFANKSSTEPPPESSSPEISTVTDSSALNNDEFNSSYDYLPQIDESFWTSEESTSEMSSSTANDHQAVMIKAEEVDTSVYIRWPREFHVDDSDKQETLLEEDISKFEFPSNNSMECVTNNNGEDDMDFWFNLFVRAEDLPELPEF